MNKLAGRTALVTNAGSGVGRATALALSHEGAQVLVHYAEGDEGVTALVEEIRRDGGRAEKVGIDLNSYDGLRELARRVHLTIGARLDILVVSDNSSADDAFDTLKFDGSCTEISRAPYLLVKQLFDTLCRGSVIVLTSPVAEEVNGLRDQAAYRLTSELLGDDLMNALRLRGVHVITSALDFDRAEASRIALEECPASFASKSLRRAAMAGDIAGVCAFLTDRRG